MFGSTVLEVAIGLAFMFTLLSLAATALRELIEALLKTRAIHLERGLRELLGDAATPAKDASPNIVQQIYNHPLVSGLFGGHYDPAGQHTTSWGLWAKDGRKRLPFGSNLPAYIPSRNLAMALIDVTARGPVTNPLPGTDEPISLERLRAMVGQLPNDNLRRAVLLALDEAKGDLERARLSLEAWFDSGMDRVSGWYKRQTQWILLGIGLLTAGLLNVDSIHVARALATQQELREGIVAQATAMTEQAKQSGDTAAFLQALKDDRAKLGQDLDGFGSLIGNTPYSGSTIPGWLLTALAVSLGAPFWFDLLNKIMVIRSTVKPYEKSGNEASEDRGGSKPAGNKLDPAPPSSGAGGGARGGSATGGSEADGFEQRQWADGDPQEGVI